MTSTAQVVASDTVAAVDTAAAQGKSFFRKIVDYIAGDIEKEDDDTGTGLKVIGGPHYDSTAKFGVGVAGTFGYRLKSALHTVQPSVLQLKGDISTAGFWSVEGHNNLIIDDDSKRSNSMMRLEFRPTYFWGMGYEMGKDNDNKTPMDQLRFYANANFLFRLTPGLFIGPFLHWEYSKSSTLEKPELLEGQLLHQHNLGAGVTIDYDTRDNITGPTRGIYLSLNQVFFPRFLGNGSQAFTRTDFRFTTYTKAWRNAIIATELRALFNFGSPSWATMALLGDATNMRGYYPGRFRDKHMLTAVAEVRQRIYRWIGATAWLGAGSVFHGGSSFHILPNAGLGLRWAFRKHVNIRLDYGFGSHGERAFIFAINEAF